MTQETPREAQTEKARQRAIATGEDRDMKRYLKMRSEDYEQANIIMARIAGLDANVSPARNLLKG